jgi:hypothetical protein
VDGGAFSAGSWSTSILVNGSSHTFAAYVTATGFVDSAIGSATF